MHYPNPNRILNFINGKLSPPQSGTYLPNINPATGDVFSEVPQSHSADVDLAVASARAAFPIWSEYSIDQRSKVLRAIAYRIEKQATELALAECQDTGKPLSVASRVDIPRSAQNFHFFADAITQFGSESYSSHPEALSYTLRHPLGTVACISPWNLPLYLLSWKIAPALAAGNCVIAKPSEMTPLTAFLLSEICTDVGLPPGALNILHGSGSQVGVALTRHSEVRAISFTGSTTTGRAIAETAASQFKKLSLEMGGKNATIIFEDCNFAEAVQQTLRAAFSNQGQICLCGSRVFVHQSIYNKFKSALLDLTSQLRVGDPMEPSTDQGAVVSEPHFNKILSCITLAEQEGGQILMGGKAAPVTGRCKNGFFVEPTWIEGLPTQCRTNQEEIFGPVATLIPFQNESEMIEGVNSTRYGLSASIWTRDLDRAHRVAARLQVGMVWINEWMSRDLRTPFGGMKESGLGREGGLDALRFFTEPKTISIRVRSHSDA